MNGIALLHGQPPPPPETALAIRTRFIGTIVNCNDNTDFWPSVPYRLVNHSNLDRREEKKKKSPGK